MQIPNTTNYPTIAHHDTNVPDNPPSKNDNPSNQSNPTTIETLQQTLGDALPDILITGTTGEHKITLTNSGHYDYTAINHYDQKRSQAIENGDPTELGRLSYEAALEYATTCAQHHNQTFDQIFND